MLKTMIYDIIMFRQTIFVILTRNTSIYALYTYSHTALVAWDSVEGKYNTIHQYNIGYSSNYWNESFFI